jgi:hypothetical protein
MNLEFRYLYRDAGNFKSFGSVIVSNPDSIAVEDAESRLREFLIDRMYFVAEHVQLPALFPSPRIESLDHSWHEFEAVEETYSSPTDVMSRTGAELIERFRLEGPRF